MCAHAAELATEALRVADVEPARALTLGGEAVALARPAGEHLSISVAERARGLAALHLSDLDASVEYLTAAVAAGRRTGSAQVLGEARMSLAGVLGRRGELGRAGTVIQQAVRDLAGDGRARALAQRGAIAQQSGRLDDALADYREALPLLRAAGDLTWVQRVLSNRAVLRVYRSEFAAAEVDLREAEALCRDLELDLQLTFCQENLGFVASRRGDVPEALRWFDEAERTYARLGTPIGSLLIDRCELLLSVRLIAEARAAAERAVGEFARARAGLQLPEAGLLLATAALLDRDPAGALQAALSAARAFGRQRRGSRQAQARLVAIKARVALQETSVRPRSVAALADRLERDGSRAAELDARLLAAQLAAASGQAELADQQLAQAAGRRYRGPAALRAQAWYAEALRRWYRGDGRATTRALCAGLRILDDHQASLGAAELRAHASGHRRDLAALGLQVAMSGGSARQVLSWVERGRASTLLVRPVRPPTDATLADLLAQLRACLSELEDARRNGRAEGGARRRQVLLEAMIRDHSRRRSPGGPATGDRSATDLSAQLARQLGNAALVEYFEFNGQLHAVTIVSGQVRQQRLASVSTVAQCLEPVLFALRRLARPRSPASSSQALRLLRESTSRLERLLVAPIAQRVGQRPLVVVPTEGLQPVPWCLLPSLEGRPVSVAPSAALWLKASSGPPASGPVLLVAGPGLRGAQREIAEVRRLYPDPLVLTGAECSVARVTDGLQRARLAHLATHGTFRADNPMFSSLLLDDGPLTVHDLEALPTVPHTVILAACDSAQSLACTGNELLGLAATFLSLGTAALVGSVVPVPDEAAAALMTGLHERLQRGLPVTVALAEAQQDLRNSDAESLTAAGAFVCLGAGGTPTVPSPRTSAEVRDGVDEIPVQSAVTAN